MARVSQRAIGSLPPGLDGLTDDRSQHGGDALSQLPESEVLNLHWVAGFIDYRGFFRQVPPGLRIVWTMHDMNPFTGGCHYAVGVPTVSAAMRRLSSDSLFRRRGLLFASLGAQAGGVFFPGREAVTGRTPQPLAGRRSKKEFAPLGA